MDPERIALCVEKHLQTFQENTHIKILLKNMESRDLNSNNLLNLTNDVNPEFIVGFLISPIIQMLFWRRL